MRIVAMVQARMGSERLPGKTAKFLQGMPMIWHLVKRLKEVKDDGLAILDDIVVIIPEEPGNSILAAAAHDAGAMALKITGDPNDLLRRHVIAARSLDLTPQDLIVRVPGDNPCVDPEEVCRIIDEAMHGTPGLNVLTSNLDRDIHGNGYPGGLGAEVYELEFLQWLERNRKLHYYREHPHKWAFDHGRVKTIECPPEIRWPDLRFDVNTQEDFDFIAGIYDALYPANPNFRTRDILAYLEGENGKRSDVKPVDHRLDGISHSDRPDQGPENSMGRARGLQDDHAKGPDD